MLMSVLPPPNPPSSLGFDPVSMLATSVLGPISNYFVAKEQAKTEKKKIQLEQRALKLQEAENAREFAASRAQSLVEPSEARRRDQILGLSIVGGAAALISMLLIVGAMKNKKAS